MLRGRRSPPRRSTHSATVASVPTSGAPPRSDRPVRDSAELRAIAGEMAAAGAFALDLEFVSESRYVPALCLLQVAWGDAERPRLAALDPLAADAEPVVALVSDPEVTVVLHSAQGDLSVLAAHFGIEARRVFDTQVAAAFLGLGDQVGYAGLVAELTGVELDKGPQFTDWCRRPLSADQFRYALDDVRYLPHLWRELSGRLERRGRLAWATEESARVARTAARRTPPEEMYRRLRGWDRLAPEGRGAARALAAWRERAALAANRPPRWLLKDAVLLEVARRLPEDAAALRRVPGVPADTLRRHGRELLAAVAEGRRTPVGEAGVRRSAGRGKRWGSALAELVRERCRAADVAPRLVASRADADALANWWLERGAGEGEGEPDLPLLSGWRRELAGQAALEWLAARGDD